MSDEHMDIECMGNHMDDEDDSHGYCEICHSPLAPYQNDTAECSACHMPGCQNCLVRGDDLFPYLCPECDA